MDAPEEDRDVGAATGLEGFAWLFDMAAFAAPPPRLDCADAESKAPSRAT